MRKIIAAINMTIDGNCDHTAGLPDAEILEHYTELFGEVGTALYGRTTYHLMEFWRTIKEKPVAEKSMNDFALAIDKTPKIVFSHTLNRVDWESATLAKSALKETVLALKQESGKDILVGSRSLIIQLMNLHFIDELQLCIHPVLAGPGMQLFESIPGRTVFTLARTKVFKGGAVILYYQPKSW